MLEFSLSSPEYIDLVNESSIVTNGLICYMDPGNRKSYYPGKTTYDDLSSYRITGSIGNGVVYSPDNGGIFHFNTSNNYIKIPVWSHYQIQNFTLSVWTKILRTTFESTIGNHSSNFDTIGDGIKFSGIGLWHDTTYYGQLRLGNVCCQTLQSAPSTVTLGWQLLTITYDTININVYKNTSTVAAAVAYSGSNYMRNPIYLGNNASSITSTGTYTDNVSSGSFGPVYLYNRALTQLEIIQNYNVCKNRYGLN